SKSLRFSFCAVHSPRPRYFLVHGSWRVPSNSKPEPSTCPTLGWSCSLNQIRPSGPRLTLLGAVAGVGTSKVVMVPPPSGIKAILFTALRAKYTLLSRPIAIPLGVVLQHTVHC